MRHYGVRNVRGRHGEQATISSAERVMTAPRAPRSDTRTNLRALFHAANCVAKMFFAAPYYQDASVRRREIIWMG